MKTIILSAMIAGLILTCAQAQDLMSIELQIERIREQIEGQVEIMRAGRESAEIRVEQAQIRVEEKLDLAQEEIDRQIALVERYRDSLSNTGQSGAEAIDRITNEWKQTVSNAYADMRVQMQKVDEMLSQLKGLRDRVSMMRQMISVLFHPSNGASVPGALNPLFPPTSSNCSGPNPGPNCFTSTQLPISTAPMTTAAQPTTTPSTTPTTAVEQPTATGPTTMPTTTAEQPTTVGPSTTPPTTMTQPTSPTPPQQTTPLTDPPKK
ncbi:MAG: hypothetical protein FJ118_19465 [Deltaproteobacteria bacterium]|nr:hypothetical protein [Deltaproteobacteria bacterium]